VDMTVYTTLSKRSDLESTIQYLEPTYHKTV
jgi:hypothetical protein